MCGEGGAAGGPAAGRCGAGRDARSAAVGGVQGSWGPAASLSRVKDGQDSPPCHEQHAFIGKVLKSVVLEKGKYEEISVYILSYPFFFIKQTSILFLVKCYQICYCQSDYQINNIKLRDRNIIQTYKTS